MDTFRNADISDEQLNKLEELIEKLEIANGCTGRVIDLGMAINFKGLNYEDLDSACHVNSFLSDVQFRRNQLSCRAPLHSYLGSF
jgi:hypothetical protein